MVTVGMPMDRISPIDLTGRTAPWPPAAVELWRASLAEALDRDQAWRTPPRAGHPELRAALGEHLGLDHAMLAVTSGVRASLSRLLHGSTRLILERPTFLELGIVAKATGTRVTLAGLHTILAGRANDTAATLWLTHPARNPDGRSLTGEEVGRLAELVPAFHRVVVNRTYQWCRPGPLPSSVTQVGTLHKLAGGGMRVGWIWPMPPGYDRVPSDGGPPAPWQLALASFIRAGGLTQLSLGLTSAQAQRRRFAALLAAGPDDDRCGDHQYDDDHCNDDHCGDGPHLLMPVPVGIPEADAVARFADAGVLVSPGSAFGAPGSLRLAFGGHTDQEVAVAAERIDNLMATAGGGHDARQ